MRLHRNADETSRALSGAARLYPATLRNGLLLTSALALSLVSNAVLAGGGAGGLGQQIDQYTFGGQGGAGGASGGNAGQPGARGDSIDIDEYFPSPGGHGGTGGTHGFTANAHGGSADVHSSTGGVGGEGYRGLSEPDLGPPLAGGGGGGGEGGAGVAIGSPGTYTIVSGATIVGGTGGTGGIGGAIALIQGTFPFSGNGGDGGAGILTSQNLTVLTVSSGAQVQGGAGGTGGAAGTIWFPEGPAPASGNGGDGGAGIQATMSTINNAGTITGGNGLTGGSGIKGAGLTVVNNNVIQGGLAADNVTRAFALEFTGGSNTLTLGSGAVLDGGISVTGTLSMDQTASSTLGNVISGSGSLIQSGSGTLTLTGTNTYSGGTQMNAGTLAVASDSNLGAASGILTFGGGTLATAASFSTARAMVFTSAGQLNVAASSELTLTGALSGSGGLVKSGDGTLVLTGTGGYSGGTTISAGTLQVGNGGTTGSLGTGDVTNNAALVFSRSDATVFAGNISGTGAVQQTGGGTLFLTGNVSHSGGTEIATGRSLSIGIGGTSGSISGAISNNGTLLFNRSDAYTVGANISGPGTVSVIGGGTASFAGSYGGQIGVLDATVRLNGASLGNASVTLYALGALGGNGSVGSVNAGYGSAVSPGNSLGTITVNGDVTFEAGSVFAVETEAAGGADLLSSTGQVTIASGTQLQVKAEQGSYAPSTTYTILSAQNISGRFDHVLLTNFAFLDAAFSYSATDLTLTLLRNGVSFTELAATINHKAVAYSTASLPDTSDIKTAVTGLSAEGARDAFEQLSGESQGSVSGQIVTDSAKVSQTAVKRLTRESFNQRFEGGDFSFTGARVWGEALGSFGKVRSSGTTSGFSRSTGGLMAGLEAKPSDNAMAGVFAGYTGSYLDGKELSSTASVSAYHAGIYGSYDFDATSWGALALRGGASYSWQDVSTRRNVSFSSISQQLKADYDVSQVQGFGEVAYGHMFSGVMQGAFVEGYTALAVVHQDGARFSETGGSAALTVRGDTLDTAFTTVGVRGEVQTGLMGLPARVTGELAWRHAFGDLDASQTMVLAGGNPFAIQGRAVDENTFVLGTGLGVTVTEKVDLSLAYQAELAERAADHSVNGKIRYRF
jgi:autotransporter-associated beta strand protein